MDRGRRALLRSVALAGSVGLAGCFGGPSGAETTVPGTNTQATTSSPSPTDTSTPTRTPTPTRTATSTPTPVKECLCTTPTHLLSFDDAELTVPPGETTTVAGRVHNPYLFEVTDVEVTLEPPSDDWTIAPVRDTSVGTLPSQAEREATWEVSVPRTAIGEYEFTSQCTYRAATNTADVQEAFAVSVVGE